ncbi:hypothetical protein HMPREF9333_00880 [Johnsonella ignava ATCC 51276]|uniref:Glycosyltransferase RgtA/B/C/D-like domain-containing protein n=1 Tax=Johnsonella ignava ATCC 51276 TaxID=679200 RepID=G5GH40_9FIRM|nr:hypothetical protein [Johnsonella ignava]EHI55837.1 hypothetical protein HMPREF9333_00880 [Johnsonella ignava ATCC 51276]
MKISNIRNIKLFDSEEKKSFAIALVIWLVMNLTGWASMYFKPTDELHMEFILLHLAFLYFLVHRTKHFIINIKDDKYKAAICIAAVYFIFNIIILFLIWPGLMRHDDLMSFLYTKSYILYVWQHFITGIYYFVCLKTLPFATGLIIIQLYIIALITGYSISNIAFAYVDDPRRRKILMAILFLPVNFLPVMAYSLSGYRIALYTFFELLFISEIITIKKQDKIIGKNKLADLTVLCIMLAVWRTEGIYYIILFPILLIFIKDKIEKNLSIMFYCIVVAAISVLIGKLNNIATGSSNYSLTATFMPLPDLVLNADKAKDKDILSEMDKVIDLNVIYQNPDETAERLFWDKDLVRKEYSDADYKKYMGAYLKLVLRYPLRAFKPMWDNFLASSGITTVENGYPLLRSNIYVYDTLFEEQSEMERLIDEKIIPQTALYEWSEQPSTKNAWDVTDSMFKKPINQKLRMDIIRMIGGINSRARITVLYRIFWNLFIPLILIIFCFIYKILKRDWFMATVILTVFGRVALVFLTSSATYLMYYLPAYMSAYIMSFFIFFMMFYNGRRSLYKK